MIKSLYTQKEVTAEDQYARDQIKETEASILRYEDLIAYTEQVILANENLLKAKESNASFLSDSDHFFIQEAVAKDRVLIPKMELQIKIMKAAVIDYTVTRDNLLLEKEELLTE